MTDAPGVYDAVLIDLQSVEVTGDGGDAIVRVLTIDNGFDSGRITASGKSEFHPVGIGCTNFLFL